MIFLDSNIFVYSADAADKAKQSRAYSIIKNAVDNPSFVISSQVLNEFSNVALSKLRKSVFEVARFIRLFRRIRVVPVVPDLTLEALLIKDQYGLQFYDSLLIASAVANGCNEFWSEDLGNGVVYSGVKVINPFP